MCSRISHKESIVGNVDTELQVIEEDPLRAHELLLLLLLALLLDSRAGAVATREESSTALLLRSGLPRGCSSRQLESQEIPQLPLHNLSARN